MTKRKKIIAGNWKMHLNTQQASVLVHRLQERVKSTRSVEVILIPSLVHLQPMLMQIDHYKFKLGAQNFHYEDEGAYTGEVSATQLKNLVHYALAGHSERRHKFGETDEIISKKVAAGIRNGIRVILCVGETAHDKASGHTKQVLHDQIVGGLSKLTTHDLDHLVIAYEPVWAISSGKNFADHKVPTPDEVKEAVVTIRHNIQELFGKRAEGKLRVIYGGSSNADNAAGYLSVEGVDGLLPGGASLNYDHFPRMVEAAHQAAQNED